MASTSQGSPREKLPKPPVPPKPNFVVASSRNSPSPSGRSPLAEVQPVDNAPSGGSTSGSFFSQPLSKFRRPSCNNKEQGNSTATSGAVNYHPTVASSSKGTPDGGRRDSVAESSSSEHDENCVPFPFCKPLSSLVNRARLRKTTRPKNRDTSKPQVPPRPEVLLEFLRERSSRTGGYDLQDQLDFPDCLTEASFDYKDIDLLHDFELWWQGLEGEDDIPDDGIDLESDAPLIRSTTQSPVPPSLTAPRSATREGSAMEGSRNEESSVFEDVCAGTKTKPTPTNLDPITVEPPKKALAEDLLEAECLEPVELPGPPEQSSPKPTPSYLPGPPEQSSSKPKPSDLPPPEQSSSKPKPPQRPKELPRIPIKPVESTEENGDMVEISLADSPPPITREDIMGPEVPEETEVIVHTVPHVVESPPQVVRDLRSLYEIIGDDEPLEEIDINANVMEPVEQVVTAPSPTDSVPLRSSLKPSRTPSLHADMSSFEESEDMFMSEDEGIPPIPFMEEDLPGGREIPWDENRTVRSAQLSTMDAEQLVEFQNKARKHRHADAISTRSEQSFYSVMEDNQRGTPLYTQKSWLDAETVRNNRYSDDFDDGYHIASDALDYFSRDDEAPSRLSRRDLHRSSKHESETTEKTMVAPTRNYPPYASVSKKGLDRNGSDRKAHTEQIEERNARNSLRPPLPPRPQYLSQSASRLAIPSGNSSVGYGRTGYRAASERSAKSRSPSSLMAEFRQMIRPQPRPPTKTIIKETKITKNPSPERIRPIYPSSSMVPVLLRPEPRPATITITVTKKVIYNNDGYPPRPASASLSPPRKIGPARPPRPRTMSRKLLVETNSLQSPEGRVPSRAKSDFGPMRPPSPITPILNRAKPPARPPVPIERSKRSHKEMEALPQYESEEARLYGKENLTRREKEHLSRYEANQECRRRFGPNPPPRFRKKRYHSLGSSRSFFSAVSSIDADDQSTSQKRSRSCTSVETLTESLMDYPPDQSQRWFEEISPERTQAWVETRYPEPSSAPSPMANRPLPAIPAPTFREEGNQTDGDMMRQALPLPARGVRHEPPPPPPPRRKPNANTDFDQDDFDMQTGHANVYTNRANLSPQDNAMLALSRLGPSDISNILATLAPSLMPEAIVRDVVLRLQEEGIHARSLNVMELQVGRLNVGELDASTIRVSALDADKVSMRDANITASHVTMEEAEIHGAVMDLSPSCSPIPVTICTPTTSSPEPPSKQKSPAIETHQQSTSPPLDRERSREFKQSPSPQTYPQHPIPTSEPVEVSNEHNLPLLSQFLQTLPDHQEQRDTSSRHSEEGAVVTNAAEPQTEPSQDTSFVLPRQVKRSVSRDSTGVRGSHHGLDFENTQECHKYENIENVDAYKVIGNERDEIKQQSNSAQDTIESSALASDYNKNETDVQFKSGINHDIDQLEIDMRISPDLLEDNYAAQDFSDGLIDGEPVSISETVSITNVTDDNLLLESLQVHHPLHSENDQQQGSLEGTNADELELEENSSSEAKQHMEIKYESEQQDGKNDVEMVSNAGVGVILCEVPKSQGEVQTEKGITTEEDATSSSVVVEKKCDGVSGCGTPPPCSIASLEFQKELQSALLVLSAETTNSGNAIVTEIIKPFERSVPKKDETLTLESAPCTATTSTLPQYSKINIPNNNSLINELNASLNSSIDSSQCNVIDEVPSLGNPSVAATNAADSNLDCQFNDVDTQSSISDFLDELRAVLKEPTPSSNEHENKDRPTKVPQPNTDLQSPILFLDELKLAVNKGNVSSLEESELRDKRNTKSVCNSEINGLVPSCDVDVNGNENITNLVKIEDINSIPIDFIGRSTFYVEPVPRSKSPSPSCNSNSSGSGKNSRRRSSATKLKYNSNWYDDGDYSGNAADTDTSEREPNPNIVDSDEESRKKGILSIISSKGRRKSRGSRSSITQFYVDGNTTPSSSEDTIAAKLQLQPNPNILSNSSSEQVSIESCLNSEVNNKDSEVNLSKGKQPADTLVQTRSSNSQTGISQQPELSHQVRQRIESGPPLIPPKPKIVNPQSTAKEPPPRPPRLSKSPQSELIQNQSALNPTQGLDQLPATQVEQIDNQFCVSDGNANDAYNSQQPPRPKRKSELPTDTSSTGLVCDNKPELQQQDSLTDIAPLPLDKYHKSSNTNLQSFANSDCTERSQTNGNDLYNTTPNHDTALSVNSISHPNLIENVEATNAINSEHTLLKQCPSKLTLSNASLPSAVQPLANDNASCESSRYASLCSSQSGSTSNLYQDARDPSDKSRSKYGSICSSTSTLYQDAKEPSDTASYYDLEQFGPDTPNLSQATSISTLYVSDDGGNSALPQPPKTPTERPIGVSKSMSLPTRPAHLTPNDSRGVVTSCDTRGAVHSFANSDGSWEEEVSSSDEEEYTHTFENSKHNRAFHVAQEVMTSERTFVDVLILINKDFREAVAEAKKKQGGSVIPDAVLNQILCYLPQLLNLNQELLADLETRIKNWDSRPEIANIIVQKGPFLKLYSSYIRDFESIIFNFEDALVKYPQFAQVVADFEASDRCKKLALKHYMLKPVQRIPQYRLLLEDYLRHVPEDSAERKQTEIALAIMKEVAEHANRTLKQGDNFSKLLQIQNKIMDHHEVIKPGRVLLKEGELLKLCRKGMQPRYFILFNDVLLYMSETQQGLYRLHYELPLMGMQVTIPTQEDHENEFSIISLARSFTLSSSSPDERNNWVKVLNTAIEENNRRRETFAACQNSKVVCGSCSSGKAPLEYLRYQSARVCNQCFNSLQKDLGSKLDDVESSDIPPDLGEQFKRLSPKDGRKIWRSIPKVLQEVSASDQSSTIAGYLHKWSKKTWKRRWFLIKDKVLYTYRASEDVAALESLPLLGMQMNEKDQVKQHEDVDSQLLFQLLHRSLPTLTFYAENPATAKRWTDAIKAAIVLE